MWFKGVELSKKGILGLGIALDHTRVAIERIYDQAYNDAYKRPFAQAQEPRSSAPALKRKIHYRAHATSAVYPALP